MSTTVNLPIGNRGAVKLIRNQGHAWGTFTVKSYDTDLTVPDTGYTWKEIDIYLGCLLDNWSLKMTPESDTIPWSCVNGKLVLDKDKTYTLEVGSKNHPFMLDAALMGLVVDKGATGNYQVLVQEQFTVTLAATETTIPLDTADILGVGTTLSEIKKVVSLYQKSNSQFWTECDTGDEANASYTWSFDGTNPDITFDAVLSATVDYDFILVVQYYRDMAAGDLYAREDGVTFPEDIDFVLSWLYKVESGANKGQKGYRIAVAKHCHNTGDVMLGGSVKEIGGIAGLTFNVNFQDDGDIEIHEGTLA